MDEGELIETDTWPASEKADLAGSISTNETSDFNLAYDKSDSPNNSKESENGTMSIDTGISRIVYKTAREIYKGVGVSVGWSQENAIFASSG
jgi:hypothetical protein